MKRRRATDRRPDAGGGPRPIGKAVGCGIASALLYGLLWAGEEQILRWTTRGSWHFVLPVAIAFVFSLVHGTFTGYFWQVLGVRAKGKRGGKA